jgi:hypothetical protein
MTNLEHSHNCIHGSDVKYNKYYGSTAHYIQMVHLRVNMTQIISCYLSNHEHTYLTKSKC